AKLADQFGRGVERAGQVVGKKSQGRHTTRAPARICFSIAISFLNLIAGISPTESIARKMTEKPFEIPKEFHINLLRLQPA
ncbi:MAG: hypothetical protein WA806_17540, partial [Bradyrhizobium sp.]